MRDGAICDWDADAGLLILRRAAPLEDARLEPEPLVAVLRERSRRAAAEDGVAPWTHRLLRPIAPDEALILFRAPTFPRDALLEFELLLFPEDSDGFDRADFARFRFLFRSDLLYDPTAPEGPGRRTRLRFFWPTGTPGRLGGAPGPTLPEGARPGVVLSQLALEHEASGGGAFAASASVSDGRARGPTVRALPDESAPLPVEFGWLEEHFADALAAAGRPAPEGFESSRFPIAEIDLSAYGAAAPAAAAAVWFLHAPLGPEGYDARDLRLVSAAPEQVEDRILLRCAWPDAAHRDLIGVWARLGRPLKPTGLLPIVRSEAGSDDDAAPERAAIRARSASDPLGGPDADAALALYLGEIARDAFAVTDPGLAPGDVDLRAELAAARREVEERLAQAAEEGGRRSREADRGAGRLGLGWAEQALRGVDRRSLGGDGAPEPALDGARRAAPESIAAFLDIRAFCRAARDGEDGPARRALAALDLGLEDFESVREQGDAALAILADPPLAAALSRARQPIRTGLGPLTLRLADALFNQDVAAWWEKIEQSPDDAARQLGLWRMLAAGADLAIVRRSRLDFGAEPPSVEAIAAGVRAAAAQADRALAAKVAADLDDPAIRRDAEHLRAPETLDQAAAAARALEAAEAAVRHDLERYAAACAAARAPGPDPFETVWSDAARQISGEGAADPETFAIAGEAALDAELDRATEFALAEAARGAGGAALAEAMSGVATRLVRAHAIRGLHRYARDVETLDRIYAELRDAIWCSGRDFQDALDSALSFDPEDIAHAQDRFRREAGVDAPVDRLKVAEEIEALRRLSGSGVDARSAPAWRAEDPRGLHLAFLRAARARLQAAEEILLDARDEDRGPGFAAAEADLRALSAGLPWIAARQVWRYICVIVYDLARSQTGRLREDAARLAARLSEPPQAWPGVQMDLEMLEARIARKEDVAKRLREREASPTAPRGRDVRDEGLLDRAAEGFGLSLVKKRERRDLAAGRRKDRQKAG
ncbi:MAG: hypothetical protein AAFW46_01440 [Pseudomonadota bacterium]